MTTFTAVVLIILSLCVVLAALIVRESVRAEIRRLRPVLGTPSWPLSVPPAPVVKTEPAPAPVAALVPAPAPDLTSRLAEFIVREAAKSERRQVAAPPPAPVISAPEPVKRTPSAELITVRLVSEKGRPLGETKIRKQERRPTMTHTFKGGSRCTFVAESGDGRSFTYRLVNRERTH